MKNETKKTYKMSDARRQELRVSRFSKEGQDCVENPNLKWAKAEIQAHHTVDLIKMLIKRTPEEQQELLAAYKTGMTIGNKNRKEENY